jgi:hypothetical protein
MTASPWRLLLAVLLAGCEGGGTNAPETVLLPGASQINLTVVAGPACPPATPAKPTGAAVRLEQGLGAGRRPGR